MSSFFSSAAVCNTGPLIGLARVQLERLPLQLFPEVIVPEEVRRELMATDSPDRIQLERMLEGARVLPPQAKPNPLLQTELDTGEAAVISAAQQLGLSTVILDERKARRVASQVYGLQLKGTAGLLLEAKRLGLIESVGSYLDGMIRGGYFLGPRLVAACLAAAKED